MTSIRRMIVVTIAASSVSLAPALAAPDSSSLGGHHPAHAGMGHPSKTCECMSGASGNQEQGAHNAATLKDPAKKVSQEPDAFTRSVWSGP